MSTSAPTAPASMETIVEVMSQTNNTLMGVGVKESAVSQSVSEANTRFAKCMNSEVKKALINMDMMVTLQACVSVITPIVTVCTAGAMLGWNKNALETGAFAGTSLAESGLNETIAVFKARSSMAQAKLQQSKGAQSGALSTGQAAAKVSGDSVTTSSNLFETEIAVISRDGQSKSKTLTS